MHRKSLFRLYTFLGLPLFLMGILSMTVSADTPTAALIPMPVSVEWTDGTFTLPSETLITVAAFATLIRRWP